MSPKKIRALFERFAAVNPQPRSELEYGSPYQLLVAVILSAQSTDKGVNRATRELFPIAGTPQAMVALGEERLAAHIASIGLFRTKAKNIIAMSRQILDRHAGEVPTTRAALEALPGVGRKTANVVLNIAFGEPAIAVDTHIFRVANRTGLAPGKDVAEVERRLLEAVPPEFRLHAHHWLVLHGRYVCKARAPRCPQCPIRDLCAWPDKT
ncbi:MAG: endonuclease III [Rhodocyclaceae bacterium]